MRISQPLIRRATAAVMLTMTTMSLAACGQSADAADTTHVSVAINAELQTLDPGRVVETTGGEILKNTQEGLVGQGKNNKPTPGIAKSWKVSADGKTYTFHLRDNATWNDGSAVTAKDFVYGWRRNVDPKHESENAYEFEPVVNGTDIAAGKKPANTLGIEAPDDHTLVIHLVHPVAAFMRKVSGGVFLPVQQKADKKYGKKYGTDARFVAYDGPYTVKSWHGNGNTWTLVKNPHYWNKKNVHLKTVTYQVVKEAATGLNMFESGQLDQVQLYGNQIQNERHNDAFIQQPTGQNYYVHVNMQNPSSATLKRAFQNRDIRRAMSLVIDRTGFTKHTLNDGSVPAKGIVSDGMENDPASGKDFAAVAYSKDPTTNGVAYDTKLAKQYWQAGMKAIGAKSLDATLTVDDDENHVNIVQYLQSTWEKQLPGMHVTIKKVPKPTRIKALQESKFDIIMSGWTPSTGVNDFLDMFITGNSYNFGHYSNAQYDQLMQTADTTADMQQRFDAMVKAEQQLMRDQGVIPLYQLANSYLRSKSIHGMIQNTVGSDPGWRGVTRD